MTNYLYYCDWPQYNDNILRRYPENWSVGRRKKLVPKPVAKMDSGEDNQSGLKVLYKMANIRQYNYLYLVAMRLYCMYSNRIPYYVYTEYLTCKKHHVLSKK